MKKLLTSTALILGLVAASMHDARAQAPERFSYQGVARDASGNILTNATVGLRLTIRAGSATGTSVYQETHATSTNALGLISVEVGGGSGGSGFSSINWGSGSYYLQAELDPAGGTAYQNMGASQLLSVPYALYAASGGSGGGGSSLDGAYDFGGAGLGRTITADAGAVLIQGTDGLTVTGGAQGTGADIEITGAGNRMFYNPKKAAFRAGWIAGTDAANWDPDSLGSYSVAFGQHTKAVGLGSFAAGLVAYATGTGSVSIGQMTRARGTNSVAMGSNAVATGNGSVAIGNQNNASGNHSRALGYISFAYGDFSFTAGGQNHAYGLVSTALGSGNSAYSMCETTIGMNSTQYTPSSETSWVGPDRLFVVGNGAGINNRSDALRMLKNGNTAIGNIDPTTRLDVDGQVRIRGGAPGAGKVLTSDANGLATWETPSGGGGSGWALTGNSGTSSTTNFIGTIDNVPLNLRVNNQRAGRLAANNTSLGYNSFNTTATGTNNTAIGISALQSATTGGGNAALGYQALKATTTGAFNVAVGHNAMELNTTGSNNVAVGSGALLSNTTGVVNTAIGNNASYANTTGFSNVAVGVSALRLNDQGYRNVAVGDSALFNTRFAPGGEFPETPRENVAVGSKALYLNWAGSGNVAIGEDAGYKVTQGANTFVGAGADVNTFNTLIINSVGLGAGATTTASHQVRFGNSFTTSIGGPVAYTNLSDGRFKQQVSENMPGVEFIKMLRPVTYNMDWKGYDVHIKGKANEDEKGYSEASAVRYSGFIAQEVEQAARSLGYEFSGVDAPKNEGDVYGLRYSEFVVPLVKAVQEQQQIIEALQQQITELRATVETLSK